MTFREYEAAASGFFDKQLNEYKRDWELTRWNTYYLLNIQIQKGHKLKRLQELVKFPWEKEIEYTYPTQKDWDDYIKKHGKEWVN